MTLKDTTPDDIATAKAKELKELIRRFEHRSFTGHLGHMGNAHIRQRSAKVKLRSPVRQLMYLMSLYHATDLGGTELYFPTGPELVLKKMGTRRIFVVEGSIEGIQAERRLNKGKRGR